jgi:hypothetical protein
VIDKPILYNKPEIDDLVKDGYDVVVGPLLMDSHQHSSQDIEDEIRKYCKSKQFDTIVVYQRAYVPKSNRILQEASSARPAEFAPVTNLTASVVYALKELKKGETGKLK